MVLISPQNKNAIEISRSLGMEYIPEDFILNHDEFIKWADKNKLSNNAGSWTWYYQQFLKILYYKISQSNDYLVIDSDIVLNKPLTLVSNNGHRTFFVGHNYGHEISKTSIKFLLGDNQYIPEFSYIADLMCFNKDIVEKMVNKIETKFNTQFYKAAILVEENTRARFSEYEMYGVYANFLENGKLLDTSVNFPIPPYSPYIRTRENISTDRSAAELQKCDYLAYHKWFSQEK